MGGAPGGTPGRQERIANLRTVNLSSDVRCPMGVRSLAVDFALLWEGVEIGEEFGFLSLEALARVGRFLEHAFYEPASLTYSPEGLSFALRNPPLRMGAFSQIRIFLDRIEVDLARASIRSEGSAEPTRLDQVDRDHPVVIPVGVISRFTLQGPALGPGPHTIRLELQSVAIPPLVWMEITDVVREGTGP